jgi:hypothetical protein
MIVVRVIVFGVGGNHWSLGYRGTSSKDEELGGLAKS